MTYYGGIEAGGTKFVCAVARGPDEYIAEERFPTSMPHETIARAIEFFSQRNDQYPLASIGIASFGPVDLNPASPAYGYITSTPKPGWGDTNFAGQVGSTLGIPVGFDTDVNAAALAESLWGAGRGLKNILYLTIGTGIGGGGIVNGERVHGALHPEMGHMRIPHDWDADPFPGGCPFHGDCLEGLANGPALEARWGTSPEDLPPDHPCWDLEAHYLALALVNLTCVYSPERIILGGGVMAQTHLFPLIRQNVKDLLNGYLQLPLVLDHISNYIVPPELGDRVGVLGAIALGQEVVRC